MAEFADLATDLAESLALAQHQRLLAKRPNRLRAPGAGAEFALDLRAQL